METTTIFLKTKDLGEFFKNLDYFRKYLNVKLLYYEYIETEHDNYQELTLIGPREGIKNMIIYLTMFVTKDIIIRENQIIKDNDKDVICY